jgi:hypothetical protein
MTLERFRPWSVLVRFWEDTAKTIPLDVSGSTFAAEMRVGAVTVAINIDVTDAALGEITLYLTEEETGTFPANTKRGRWDLEQTTGGVPTTVVPTQQVVISTPVTVP